MSCRDVEGGVIIDIFVQPRASRQRFGPVHGDRIKVFVTSPPVDGAANQSVVDLLSKTFSVARRNVSVTAGQSSRRKTVELLGVSSNDVAKAVR